MDLRKDPLALQRLKESAEKAKIELSTSQQTDLNLPYITADQTGPKHLNVKLTRSKLESLVEDLVDRTIEPCRMALKDAGLSAGQINEVILVGGQTRMPKVQAKVEEFFGKAPRKDVNPDEAVAVGAAIQGGVLGGQVKDVLLLDVTPLSLGIETLGGVMTKLIEKNTTIPTSAQQVFSTADDNQTAVTVHVLQGERERAVGQQVPGALRSQRHPAGPARRAPGRGQVRHRRQRHPQRLRQGQGDRQAAVHHHQGLLGSVGCRDAKMVKDAEAHAEEDRRFHELVTARNQADSMIHATRKSMEQLGDKMEAGEKSAHRVRHQGPGRGHEGRGQGPHRVPDQGLGRGLRQDGRAALCPEGPNRAVPPAPRAGRAWS